MSYNDDDENENEVTINLGCKSPITAVGAIIAIALSYAKWGSIGWAFIAGLCHWIYVIYYILKYVTPIG